MQMPCSALNGRMSITHICPNVEYPTLLKRFKDNKRTRESHDREIRHLRLDMFSHLTITF